MSDIVFGLISLLGAGDSKAEGEKHDSRGQHRSIRRSALSKKWFGRWEGMREKRKMKSADFPPG